MVGFFVETTTGNALGWINRKSPLWFRIKGVRTSYSTTVIMTPNHFTLLYVTPKTLEGSRRNFLTQLLEISPLLPSPYLIIWVFKILFSSEVSSIPGRDRKPSAQWLKHDSTADFEPPNKETDLVCRCSGRDGDASQVSRASGGSGRSSQPSGAGGRRPGNTSKKGA